MAKFAPSTTPLRSTRPCVSSNVYSRPAIAPATTILRPEAVTVNEGTGAIPGNASSQFSQPNSTFLEELLGFTVEEEDFAEELDFGAELLDTTVELDRGVTLELDFALLELDFGTELLLGTTLLLEDFAEELLGGGTLELDRGADEELDTITLDELERTTPKIALIAVSP